MLPKGLTIKQYGRDFFPKIKRPLTLDGGFGEGYTDALSRATRNRSHLGFALSFRMAFFSWGFFYDLDTGGATSFLMMF